MVEKLQTRRIIAVHIYICVVIVKFKLHMGRVKHDVSTATFPSIYVKCSLFTAVFVMLVVSLS